MHPLLYPASMFFGRVVMPSGRMHSRRPRFPAKHASPRVMSFPPRSANTMLVRPHVLNALLPISWTVTGMTTERQRQAVLKGDTGMTDNPGGTHCPGWCYKSNSPSSVKLLANDTCFNFRHS